jgi:hypothetical protein
MEVNKNCSFLCKWIIIVLHFPDTTTDMYLKQLLVEPTPAGAGGLQVARFNARFAQYPLTRKNSTPILHKII